MTDSRRYKAFISYSHSDERWARWLQRSLERYRLPKALLAKHPELPKRLFPVFRDRDELASGGDLSDSIRQAMDDSEALIVICSPAARTSRWVNEEIKRFRATDRGHRIFCLLVAGSPEPDAPDCAFPSALLLGDDGEILHEPLAADATAKGDGKRNAMLKIAAGLLNVGVDELKRRDAQRQARFWSFVAAGSLLIATLTIGLAIYALNAKRESEIARKESELRRSQAEGLIGFMLGDLRKKLEPIGKLDILDAVGEQAMSYFTTLGNRGTQKELLARAVALKQIGDVRFNQGKLEPALKSFQQALIQSEALYKTDPNNNDYLFELGQAEFWVGYVAWERGQLDQAAVSMQRYMQYSEQLSERAPDNAGYRLELGFANNNLGAISLAQNNPEAALGYYSKAANINKTLLINDPDNVDVANNVTETLSWLGTTYIELKQLDKGSQAYQQGLDALLPFYKANKDQSVKERYARLLFQKAEAVIQTGAVAEGNDLLKQSLGIWQQLLETDSSNANWRQVSLFVDHFEQSLLNPRLRTPVTRKQLESLLSQFESLTVSDPTSSDNNIYLARTQRLRIIDLVVGNNIPEALKLADQSWSHWQKFIAGKSPTPKINLVSVMLEETVGTAYAAAGQNAEAIQHWQHSAAVLDAKKQKNLAELAVRRLLAINLGQTEKAKDIEKQLLQAGFRDPRMQPAYTLSGSFHQSTSTTPP
jgi:tetratricopeptide (TPR) repeat protein